ncbi:unnamed protein product [Owenia fusiformis]|uniref:Uncharacterized protein n=1 Tax=Owenia fusiformis TaxID=6347 RepID=A0A8J1TGA6_OWEFU|nr:unnamed protein product [Owenia fusiformis]
MTAGEKTTKGDCSLATGPNNEVTTSIRIIKVETLNMNDQELGFDVECGKQNNVMNLRDKLVNAIEDSHAELLQRSIEEFELMVKEGKLVDLQDQRLMHSNGMSLLQYAIFKGNKSLALKLLELGGRNFGPLETKTFKGGSSLHHALVHDMPDMVKIIAGNPDEFNMLSASKATGIFFKGTFDGFELPLFLACWSRNIDMVRLLFEINPRVLYHTDSKRQNMLHCLVNLSDDATEEVNDFVHGVIKMILSADGGREALECLLEMRDGREETPMAMAFRKTEYHFIHVILNQVLKRETFRYGSSTSFVEYDISCIESIKAVDGNISSGAPGMYYIGTSSGTLRFPNIFSQHPFRKLLSLRNSANMKPFIVSMVWHMFLMIWLNANSVQRVIIRGERNNGTMIYNGTASVIAGSSLSENAARNFIFVNDCFFLAYGIVSFLKEIIHLLYQIIKARRLHLSWREILERQFNIVTGTGSFALIYIIFSVALFYTSFQYLAGLGNSHMTGSIAIQTCCLYFTIYLRNFEYTSFYILTVMKMLFGDVVRFLLTVVGMFFGFTGAFYLLYDDAYRMSDVATYGDTVLTTYKVMVGMADFNSLIASGTNALSNLYLIMSYIAFTIIVTILMFNMLIGIMANTINEVAEQKDALFELQKLACSMNVERQMFWTKGFVRNAVDKGHLNIKKVLYAGEERKRLFIECLEVNHGNSQTVKRSRNNERRNSNNKTYMGNYNIHAVSYGDTGDR